MTVESATADMRRKHAKFERVGRLGPAFWAYREACEVLEKLTGRKVVAGVLQR